MVVKMVAATRFPKRQFFGQSMQTSMMTLISMREKMELVLQSTGFTGRSVMGYKLPEWQRPCVWTVEQCQNFIQSTWMGVGLGAFMVNSSQDDELNLILLDGQQRLRSIERYIADEFAVLADDGNSYLWSDLTDSEQANFLRIPFPWIETSYKSDEQLRLAYDRHNFGGTAHAESQRATAKA